MAVLLTDGDQRATLAVARSLGRAGIPVVVAEERESSIAGASRFCFRRLRYPSPLQDPVGFQACVLEHVARGGYDMVVPMTDITTLLLSPVRDRLETHVRLPMAPSSAQAQANDKREMMLAATRVGIGTPATYMLHEDDDLAKVAANLEYPVVLKPRFSRFLSEGRWVFGRVRYVHDPGELQAQYRELHAQIPCPLVQEKIEGDGSGVFLLVWNGVLKAAFCHRRLREKPPSGGVSVLRESAPLDQPLLEKSLALLRAIGWNGVAMVEYKIDRRDGEAKLMEVNGRFWGSLQLAIDAGVDFPVMLYRLAKGEDVPPQLDYRVGVKSRWLLGDLDHLLIRWRHPAEANGLPGSLLSALLQFLKFHQRDTYYEVFKFDDPGPGWTELRQYCSQLFHRPGKG